jgi:hypothetical protein
MPPLSSVRWHGGKCAPPWEESPLPPVSAHQAGDLPWDTLSEVTAGIAAALEYSEAMSGLRDLERPTERREEAKAAIAACRPVAERAAVGAARAATLGGEEARRKLGEANTKRRRVEIEWVRTHEKPDAEVFTREILPQLMDVSLSKMKAATGLSVTMCSKVRRGYVPHARHWDGLRQLVMSKD